MADTTVTVPINYDDPLHPLYLHHSDQPGITLVSQPLTGENYSTWSRAVIMALSAKNKVGFINGSIPKPADSDPDFPHWLRCNNMVLSWLFNSLSKDLAASAIYSDSATALWKDLKERFSQSNAPHIFHIEQAIHELTQHTMSVATYFTKLKGLWDELNAISPLPLCSCDALREILAYQQRQRTISYTIMVMRETMSLRRMEVLSNGRYKSVVHRATVKLDRKRISIASLHSLGMDKKVRPAAELVDEDHPVSNEPFSFSDFLEYISSQNPIARFIDTLKRSKAV